MAQSEFRLMTCILLLYVYSDAAAQQWIPNFKHYGIRDGLPSSEVTRLAATTKKIFGLLQTEVLLNMMALLFRFSTKKIP